MQTTIQFARDGDRLNVVQGEIAEDDEILLIIQYAPTATVWRMNLGWRRRKESSIYGFNIDTVTGEWSKDEQAPAEHEKDFAQEERNINRITPYVEDRRNVLILRPASPLNDTVLTTLQYALKRGIEEEYQIEESELICEPLPNRDDRRTRETAEAPGEIFGSSTIAGGYYRCLHIGSGCRIILKYPTFLVPTVHRGNPYRTCK